MKKMILIAGIAMVFVVAVLVLRNSGSDNSSGNNNDSSEATVSAIAGEISIKKAGASAFTAFGDSAVVASGDEIKTSQNGRAEIAYEDGTVTLLDQDSDIIISNLGDGGRASRITLTAGSLWAKIKNVLGAGEYYEVETENTVASVRGTIFGMEYRNRVSTAFGVENTVRVRLRNPANGAPIDATGTDITSGEKTNVGSDVLPPLNRPLVKRAFENGDLTGKNIKDMITRIMDESDARTEPVKNLLKRVIERNLNDTDFRRRLVERRLSVLESSATPSRTPSPSASISPKPSVSLTPSPSVSPAVSTSSTPGTSPSATPEPTPDTSPVLESVIPKTISSGQEFTLNGKYFTIGRNVKQITAVSVGGVPAMFAVLDSLTIFVTPSPNLTPGTYDVSATTTAGSVLLLKQAVTIQ